MSAMEILSKGRVLVYSSTGTPIHVGDRVYVLGDERQVELCILGGTAPLHDSSTGRVYVREVTSGFRRELLPKAIGADWWED